MAMARVMEPEWLDTLPEDDPGARRSRDDLARLNGLMSNARYVARGIRNPLRRIADIGAGDGRFALRLARALPEPRSAVQAALVDRGTSLRPNVVHELGALGWKAHAVRADVFEWLSTSATHFDAIVANLFLHHFDSERLGALLELVSRRTALFIACEPRRSTLALAAARMAGFAGCNHVTRHDAVASVRAGFRGDEVSRLWSAAGWDLEESACGLFCHRFVARRRESF